MKHEHLSFTRDVCNLHSGIFISGSQPQLPENSKLLKNGQIAKSVRAQNRAVAGWLPPHHTAYCQAISEFTRYLLDMPDTSLPPPPPTDSELAALPTLSEAAILGHTAVFSVGSDPIRIHDSTQKLQGRRKVSWVTHRHVFLLDLSQSGVPRATFEWITSRDSQWDNTMLVFLVKHIKWADKHDAFSRYSINRDHTSDEILWGVLERWLRGRAEDRAKRMRNPDFYVKKLKNSRRKSVRTCLASH